MKFYFIALVSCICLVACGGNTKIYNDNKEPAQAEIDKQNSATPTLVNGGGPLVWNYYRLVSLAGYKERGERWSSSLGFYYRPDAKRYIIGIGYEARRLSEYEIKEVWAKNGENGVRKLNSFDGGWSENALINKIEKIEIVSNANFNEIPAGQSLASKFEFFSGSAWPILQSAEENVQVYAGRTDFGKLFGFYPFCTSFEPIHKDISDLKADDLIYLFIFVGQPMHMSACWMAKEVPEIKEHVFTISYFEGDKVWSVDIPAVFEPIGQKEYREKFGY